MLTKFRLAALALAAAAVLIAPASALAEDPAPEGIPAQWTYNGDNAQGWTYTAGQQSHPTKTFIRNSGLNLCELVNC